MSDAREKNNFRGYLIAAGCSILLFLVMGIQVAQSIFLSYRIKDLDTTFTVMSVLGMLSMGASCIGSIFVAKCNTIFGPHRCLLFGLMGTAVYCVINALSSNLFVIALGSILAGVSLSIGTIVSMTTLVSQWFSEKRASVIAVIIGIEMLGGSVFSALYGILLQFFTWRQCEWISAGISILIGIPVHLFFIQQQVRSRIMECGVGLQPEDVADREKLPRKGKLALVDLIRAPRLLLFAFAFGLGAMVMTATKTYAATFWIESGETSLNASFYVSLLTLIGVFISIFSGRIIEKRSPFFYISLIYIPIIVSLVGMFLWPMLRSDLEKYLVVGFISMIIPLSNIASLLIPVLFGNNDYTSINSFCMVLYYFFIVVCMCMFGSLRDIAGSFRMAWLVLIAVAVCAYVSFAYVCLKKKTMMK